MCPYLPAPRLCGVRSCCQASLVGRRLPLDVQRGMVHFLASLRLRQLLEASNLSLVANHSFPIKFPGRKLPGRKRRQAMPQENVDHQTQEAPKKPHNLSSRPLRHGSPATQLKSCGAPGKSGWVQAWWVLGGSANLSCTLCPRIFGIAWPKAGRRPSLSTSRALRT